MELPDFIALIHPAIAIAIFLPLIGIVVNFAWFTRQRRLQNKTEGKIKINPSVGTEYRRLGNSLTSAIVGLNLLEIPLSWQESYVDKCDFVNKTCSLPQSK
jgi:hypothetical protein